MADKVDLRVQSKHLRNVLVRTWLNNNWCWTGANVASCHFLNPPICVAFLLPSTPRPPFIFIQLLPCWGASSRPVGVERPICEFILLCRRAVNTHFCGCQLGEGGQPCGTQRRISSVPSSGNRAGFKEKPFFCSLFSPPREQHYCF